MVPPFASRTLNKSDEVRPITSVTFRDAIHQGFRGRFRPMARFAAGFATGPGASLAVTPP